MHHKQLIVEVMNTKRWVALGITALVIVGSLALIKILPFYATIACLITFVLGFISGYIFKNKEVVEKIVEKIVEVEKPIKVAKPKKNKKQE